MLQNLSALHLLVAVQLELVLSGATYPGHRR